MPLRLEQRSYARVVAVEEGRGVGLERVRDALTSPQAKARGLFRTSYVDRLLADPNAALTPLRGNRLWQLGLLEMWLQERGL